MPWPQRTVIAPIRKVPAFLAAPFARINAAFKVLQAIANMEGKGGIKITKAESNWVIESTESGLPDGYVETEVTVCEDGEPVVKYALLKDIE